MATDQPTPTKPDRLTVLTTLVSMIEAGLPAPEIIDLRAPGVTLDVDGGPAVRDAWAAALSLDHRRGQPHPLLSGYRTWLSSVSGYWMGLWVSVNTSEPITDEHIAGWVSSGQAKLSADYAAELAAKAAEAAKAGEGA